MAIKGKRENGSRCKKVGGIKGRSNELEFVKGEMMEVDELVVDELVEEGVVDDEGELVDELVDEVVGTETE
jgi:hypothetical protein